MLSVYVARKARGISSQEGAFAVQRGHLSEMDDRDKLRELMTAQLAKPNEDPQMVEEFLGVPCKVCADLSLSYLRLPRCRSV